MKTKSNVYFFTAKNDVNILNALKEDNSNFVCYGTGPKAFKQAMNSALPNETVYQIKIGIEKTEILYTY